MVAAFERYADRPALAERRAVPLDNVEQQRAQSRTLDAYRVVTYRDLGARVASVARQLRDGTRDLPAVREGERLAMLGYAGIDFTTVDFACNVTGIVSVPLQTSGTHEQQSAILAETAPRALAVTVGLLERGTRLARENPSIERLLVLDYRGGDDTHRQAVERAGSALGRHPETLDLDRSGDDPGRGAGLAGGTAEGREVPAMLLYTSGSTGSPKGAIYTERLISEMWGGEGWSEFFAEDAAVVSFHYMPMSHVAGHSSVRSTLARGGLTAFASSPNLAGIFEDLSLARPTELSLVPRVCELLREEYQRRLDLSRGEARPASNGSPGVIEAMREDVLGGRVRWASCTSAPVSPDLKAFTERLLGIELHELYGTTEIGGVLADGRFLSPPVLDYRVQDVPELGYFTSDLPRARGELLVKSTSTVPGYFNRPELNREIFTSEGYYRTGDIVAVEPDGRVRIIDRKNAIIKLAQGEFVALPSLEAAYVAGSPLVRQVYLHGLDDHSAIVGVVVPSDALRDELDDDLAGTQRRLLEDLRRVAAQEDFASYEVPVAILVEPEPFSEANGLLSDHRKPLRPRLAAAYGSRLAALATQLRSAREDLLDHLRAHGAEDDPVLTVRRAVAVTLQADLEDVPATARFRHLGGDSLSAVSLSRLLEQIYGVRVSVDTVASASYTLTDLAAQIVLRRSSSGVTPSFEDVHGTAPDRLLASDLTVPRVLGEDLTPAGRSASETSARVVLVTGANGHLGRTLCMERLRAAAGTAARVVCLVRAGDDAAAHDRLRAAYATSERLVAEFDDLSPHLEVLAGDLSSPRLGLSDDTWHRLAGEVTEIVHAGAMVNHALGYRELYDANVVGTAEVARLAVTGHLKPVTFLSSIATALLPGAERPLDEIADIRRELPEVAVTDGIVDGYAATKWAGEVLLRDAHERFGLPVTVVRASMILAHTTEPGLINVPDTFTRLLYSVVRTGLAPASFYRRDGHTAHYDGLPVDTVVAALEAVVVHDGSSGFTTYHLVNPFDDGVSLDRMVDWLTELGVPLTRIASHGEWWRRFGSALRQLGEEDQRASVLPLLDAFARAEEPARGSLIPSPRFVAALLSGGGQLTSLTPAFLHKCVGDLELLFDQSLRAAPASVSDG